MKRKVIQLAGKTLLVSLPSKWARNMGVKKGDDVEVEAGENRIVISTGKSVTIQKAVLDARNMSRQLIKWALPAIQKSGFDEIEVMYDSPETGKAINEIVKDLFIGFAITEQSSHSCVIRCIASEMETEFDAMLRRAFLVTISMAESLHQSLSEKKYTKLQDILQLESTNNQLINFCQRILNKKGYKEYRKTCFAYVVVWELEKICDTYKHIINNLPKKITVSEDNMTLLKETNAILKDYYELYYKFDPKRLEAASEKIKQMEQKFEEKDKISGLLIMQLSLLSSLSSPIIALNY